MSIDKNVKHLFFELSYCNVCFSYSFLAFLVFDIKKSKKLNKTSIGYGYKLENIKNRQNLTTAIKCKLLFKLELEIEFNNKCLTGLFVLFFPTLVNKVLLT